MRPRHALGIDKLVALAATVALAANSYHVPSEQFWTRVTEGRGWIMVVLLAVAGVFVVFTPTHAFASRNITPQRLAFQRTFLRALGDMLETTAQVTPPLQSGDLGLHLWRPRRSWRHPFARELERIATYRLGSSPVTRVFRPKKGVGVVGLCWRDNADHAVDVEEIAAEVGEDEAAFERKRMQAPDSVMGLTWQQFLQVRHRGAVFATPIRGASRARFTGCVSADASHGFGQLSEVKRRLDALAAALEPGTFDSL